MQSQTYRTNPTDPAYASSCCWVSIEYGKASGMGSLHGELVAACRCGTRGPSSPGHARSATRAIPLLRITTLARQVLNQFYAQDYPVIREPREMTKDVAFRLDWNLFVVPRQSRASSAKRR